MQIEYLPSFADYWALYLHVLGRQFKILRVFAVGLVMVFLATPFLGNQHGSIRSYVGTLPVLILPALIGLVYALSYWGAKKRWAAAVELREKRVYEIDESGIRVQSESVTAFNDWRILVRAEITKRFVYIITAQRQFFYFPISSVNDIDALTALLESKIKLTRLR